MSLIEQINARPAVHRSGLALLILVVAMGLIWTVVVEPLIWLMGSQDEWRTDVRHELARARGRAASEPQLRKRLSALSAAPAWNRFYKPAGTEDVSSLVQRDVMSLAAGSGVTLQTVVAAPKVKEAGLEGYGIRFSASMDAERLKKFMDAIRANTRYLRVERLNVTAPQSQHPEQNSALTLTAEVFGYIRGDKP